MTNDGPSMNTIVYDAENHAVSSNNGSSSGTYTYDGEGHRVKKVSEPRQPRGQTGSFLILIHRERVKPGCNQKGSTVPFWNAALFLPLFLQFILASTLLTRQSYLR
jgi:YD repeat-containing protein